LCLSFPFAAALLHQVYVLFDMTEQVYMAKLAEQVSQTAEHFGHYHLPHAPRPRKTHYPIAGRTVRGDG